ncbi:MAG: cell envelope integrity EipB family protein [Alphaproteobacteria bacterium]|nr:cell envelope integrity EipB family protein [Alphaproteobacteria bacterium]
MTRSVARAVALAAWLALLPLAAPAPAEAQSLAQLQAPREPRPQARRAPARAAVTLVSHRAAYQLQLYRARAGSDVQGAEGAMYFEITDHCNGWSSQQRFTLTVIQRDGNAFEMGSDYITFETADGSRMRHRLRQTTDGQVTQTIVGEARLRPRGAGVARYREPDEAQVPLPRGTLLPQRHTIRAIQAAIAGQRRFLVPVFDGTTAQGAQDVNTVIGNRLPPFADERFPELRGQPSWRMRIAYFDREGQNATPEYEVGVRYFSNGVADEIRMDFGEFIVEGRLTELEVVPRRC